MSVDDRVLFAAEEADVLELTYGLILRATPRTIKNLKQYLSNQPFHIVFQKITMERLYIINEQEYGKLQEVWNK